MEHFITKSITEKHAYKNVSEYIYYDGEIINWKRLRVLIALFDRAVVRGRRVKVHYKHISTLVVALNVTLLNVYKNWILFPMQPFKNLSLLIIFQSLAIKSCNFNYNFVFLFLVNEMPGDKISSSGCEWLWN